MAGHSIIPVFLVCLCLKIALVSGASKCYYCSTSVDPNCGDPFVSGNVQDCATSTNDAFNCVKYVHVLDGRTLTFRSCRSARDSCDNIKQALLAENNQVLSCNICTGDLCNSSSIINTSLGLLGLTVLAVRWF